MLLLYFFVKKKSGHQIHAFLILIKTYILQVLYGIGPSSEIPRVRRSVIMDVGRPSRNHRRKRRSSNYLDESGQLRDRDILSAGWNQGSSNGTNMRGLAIDEDLLEHPLPLSVLIAIC